MEHTKNSINYTVTPEVHNAISAFFQRLDTRTIHSVLSAPREGVEFSKDEIDIMQFFLTQFYIEAVLPNNQ